MNDLVLESIRAAILLYMLIYLVKAGMKRRELCRKGWSFIIAGFGLLFFANVMDITDNFESLNRFVVIGDTPAQAFLEKMVGFSCGFLLLTIGLVRWIPTIKGVEHHKKRNKELKKDITEHKQIEEEISQERENLKAIFDAVPVCMMLVDVNIVIRNVNNVLSKLVDKNESQLIGVQPGDGLCCIYAIDDEKGCGHGPKCSSCVIRNASETVLKTGQPQHNIETQVTLIVNDRQIEPWLNISAEPVTLQEKPHVILTLQNISNRKDNEKKLQETLDKLERFNKLMIGRETRIIEMKKEVNALLIELGKEPYYQSVLKDEAVSARNVL